MKKILILSLLALLGFAPHVFAQGFTALAPIPNLTSPEATSVIQSQGLASFFNNLYKYLIGVAAVLAVIEIIWGGLQYSTQDSISKQGEGRERITQAIFGLVLVLSPVLVFSIINPSILNLSLSLPPINLTTTPVPTTTTLPTCTTSLQKNCTQPAVNAVAEGLYPTAQPGGWCYQIQPSGGNSYSCGNQTQCEANIAVEQAPPPKGNSGANLISGASCALY